MNETHCGAGVYPFTRRICRTGGLVTAQCPRSSARASQTASSWRKKKAGDSSGLHRRRCLSFIDGQTTIGCSRPSPVDGNNRSCNIRFKLHTLYDCDTELIISCIVLYLYSEQIIFGIFCRIMNSGRCAIFLKPVFKNDCIFFIIVSPGCATGGNVG